MNSSLLSEAFFRLSRDGHHPKISEKTADNMSSVVVKTIQDGLPVARMKLAVP